jgi:hypothetical protein
VDLFNSKTDYAAFAGMNWHCAYKCRLTVENHWRQGSYKHQHYATHSHLSFERKFAHIESASDMSLRPRDLLGAYSFFAPANHPSTILMISSQAPQHLTERFSVHY